MPLSVGDDLPTLMMAGLKGSERVEYLTVTDTAALKNCSVQYIKKLCKDGKLSCTIEINDRKRPKYLIPVSALPADLQAKYYARQRQEAGIEPPKTAVKQNKSRPKMTFEDFSEAERESIVMWKDILLEWQGYRNSFEGKKTEVDKLFIGKCQLEHPELQVSMDVLYRKWAAYKENDLAGILGKRGGANKGASSIPDKVWNAFLWYWLDDNQPTVSTCFKATKEWTQDFYPELLEQIPSERAFRRHLERDVSEALKICARKGDKAMKDRCEPYIDRMYDQLHANDVWIADNHTLDIMTVDGDGVVHRLYLTAFLDAKSGVLVGWNITDTPTSQSTVLALRHGIKRFGIPKIVYVDNGREFLTHDIGGKGHRGRTSSEDEIMPPTILQRLGIVMRNALVRNADAKPIERTFSTVTMQFAREFKGYCGGTIMMKPESLKRRIKEGRLPCDFEVREALNDWIDYEFNMQEYGGKEAKFRGMSRLDVWNKDIKNVGVRMAEESDLNLMLMRSTRFQKIKRNGVYVTFSGEKLWYMDYEHTWEHIGEEVYVRYDPADPRTVRIYDKDDRYLWTWGVADKVMQDYITNKVDELSDAIAIQNSVGRRIKADLKAVAEGLEPAQRIDLLDMSVRRQQRNKGDFMIELPSNIIPVRPSEQSKDVLEQASGGEVVIDIRRINRNLESKKEE